MNSKHDASSLIALVTACKASPSSIKAAIRFIRSCKTSELPEDVSVFNDKFVTLSWSRGDKRSTIEFQGASEVEVIDNYGETAARIRAFRWKPSMGPIRLACTLADEGSKT